jgi:hypothetical protein
MKIYTHIYNPLPEELKYALINLARSSKSVKENQPSQNIFSKDTIK